MQIFLHFFAIYGVLLRDGGWPRTMQIAHATLRNKGSPAHVLLRTPSQKNGFERVHVVSRSGGYPSSGRGVPKYCFSRPYYL